MTIPSTPYEGRHRTPGLGVRLLTRRNDAFAAFGHAFGQLKADVETSGVTLPSVQATTERMRALWDAQDEVRRAMGAWARPPLTPEQRRTAELAADKLVVTARRTRTLAVSLDGHDVVLGYGNSLVMQESNRVWFTALAEDGLLELVRA